MGLLDRFRNMFNKEQRIITQINDPSVLNRKVKVENAQLRAEVLKLKNELKDIYKSKKPDPEELEVLNKVERQKEKLVRHRELKKVTLKMVEPTNVGFFLKSNRRFGTWVGLQMRETNDGRLLYYPLLQKDNKLFVFDEPVTSVNSMFRSPIGVVSQIRGGKFDSNFDVTKDGKPILRADYDFGYLEDYAEDLKSELAQRTRDYEQRIEELNQELQQKNSHVKDLKEQLIYQNGEKAELEMGMDLASQERDIWAGKLASNIQKMAAMTRDVATAMSAVQDLAIDQTTTRDLNLRLLDIIRGQREQLTEEYHVSSDDKKREEVLETFDRVADVYHGAALKGQPQPQKQGGAQ